MNGPHTNATCPKCSESLDAATGVNGKPVPQEGDWSVCLYCGEVLRFTDDGSLRRASTAEIQVLRQEEPETAALLVKAVLACKMVKS